MFSDVAEDWGMDHEGFSTGAAYADLDRDGDLDMILNNIDDQASIYLNNSAGQAHNYVQLKLKGTVDNVFGIGTSVVISSQGNKQYHHLQSSRGFQSSVEPILHFGLGSATMVDSIVLTWPNRTVQVLTEVGANQTLEIIQANSASMQKSHRQRSKLFTNNSSRPAWKHQENPFDDFAREILLPHRYSRLGPFVTVGDVNGDNLDDFYVGGAKDQSGALFVQNQRGTFKSFSQKTWNADALHEDMGSAFFDYDLDGDMDLLVTSGGNDFTKMEALQDRLYSNDGKGHFTRMQDVLPKRYLSSSIVRPEDIDADGDLDLFIGGRQAPGKYPFPVSSQILINTDSKFEDVTSMLALDLIDIGMVTDAQWTDYDGDDDFDLILVGEWMPITILENNEGQWSQHRSTSLDSTHGWWSALTQADIDQDGDMDYVVGNLGTNYKYKASTKEPFQVFAHDFDDNGSIDIVLGYFDDGELFPLRGRQCSSEQMPQIKKEFPSYTAFASATLTDVYGENDLRNALHLNAYTFASMYIENDGDGKFTCHTLPAEVQFSSVNGIVVEDINHDNLPDIIVAGNMYGSEVETVRNDAGLGVVLLGNGKGSFLPLSPVESGFIASGDLKSLAGIHIGHAFNLIAGYNNDSLQSFDLQENAPLPPVK